MKDALLQAIGVALDGLDVGYCAFDAEDRTLAWNRTFLSLFPEHDGQVHVGEAYASNLRRFYKGRLSTDEAALIDQFISEGIARHRTQRRPYEFDHRARASVCLRSRWDALAEFGCGERSPHLQPMRRGPEPQPPNWLN